MAVERSDVAKVLALPVVIGLVVLGVWLGRCTSDDFNPDQPPEEIPGDEVMNDLPPENRGLGRRITHEVNPPRRRGVAEGAAKDKAEEFAEAVRDSAPSEPVLPEVRGVYEDGNLKLAVGDSRGDLQREDTKCPEPCSFGTRDNRLFSESPRKPFRFDWKQNLKICGGVAVLGAAVGAKVDEDNRLRGAAYGAGGGFVGCEIVSIPIQVF